jgi:rod shape-determining protein MreD
MTNITNYSLKQYLYSYTPIILLFISVLNEFDFNFLEIKYFSFNFSYILIFYYSVKKSKSLGYGLIFIAGLFNDVVLGMPLGISSLAYLLICGFAAYLRNITLRPSLIKDWIFFLITISVVNSLLYIALNIIFLLKIDYFYYVTNTLFTFFLCFIFSYLFSFYENKIIGKSNA